MVQCLHFPSLEILLKKGFVSKLFSRPIFFLIFFVLCLPIMLLEAQIESLKLSFKAIFLFKSV